MAISDWGFMVAMPTPGMGVVLHYVEDCDEHEPVVLMRASCGLEAEGVILDWFDRLPRNTNTCDYCFVSLPARWPVHWSGARRVLRLGAPVISLTGQPARAREVRRWKPAL